LESHDESIDNYDSDKDPEYIPLENQNIEEPLLSVETEVNSYCIITQNIQNLDQYKIDNVRSL